LIKDAFLTSSNYADETNAGIYGIRFYIRGKPWVLDVDDYLLFSSWNYLTDTTDAANPILVYGFPSDNDMWGPIMEKAWSKVKGCYINSDGGFSDTGMRAIVGAPSDWITGITSD